MSRRLLMLALVGLGLALAGFAVVASGIVNISASSGHFRITAWLLEFAMERSVKTHALGLEAPALDVPGLVLKGAGHYEGGCRPCHGAPGEPVPAIAAAMTPPPPHLQEVVSAWRPEELFYIVKHGVKLTGMPAWPSQRRDDEVWAMVAFLRELPGLDAEAYARRVARLTRPSTAVEDFAPTGVLAAARCARCHGEDRPSGAFPSLRGQKREYLLGALRAYSAGKRHSGIMQPVALALSDDQAQQLSAFYGDMTPRSPEPPRETPDPRALERAREIVAAGIPDTRTPSCSDCHGPNAPRAKPHYPRLAAQDRDYLLLQLKLFRARDRGGGPSAHLMHEVVDRLNEDEMRAVALYYSLLTPEP